MTPQQFTRIDNLLKKLEKSYPRRAGSKKRDPEMRSLLADSRALLKTQKRRAVKTAKSLGDKKLRRLVENVDRWILRRKKS